MIESPASGKSFGKFLYWIALGVICALAAWRRFSLPITPILDVDSANFLWPALLKLNGAGFVHNAGLTFIYPGFLFLLLGATASFSAISVTQHLLGLAGAVFFLLAWNRLRDFVGLGGRRKVAHAAIGLAGVGIYLLSPIPIFFEHEIRAEALCPLVQLLVFWLFFEFLFHRRAGHSRRLLVYGVGTIAGALLLYSLKPSYAGSALMVAGAVVFLAMKSKLEKKSRVVFLLGVVAVGLIFILPEQLLARSDRLSRMFLPQTLFAVHANIIREQIEDDLARGTPVPFDRTWLRRASDELGGELVRLRAEPPAQFARLGFDPDYVMNGREAMITRWLHELGGDPELKRFLDFYFWRSVCHRPLEFLAKIYRQLAVFYSWQCPAFTAHRRVALVAWHYQTSLAAIQDAENWEQLGAVPGGAELRARTEEITAHESFFDSGKRTVFIHAILARGYLPLLIVSVALALWVLIFERSQNGHKSAALVVVFLFLFNFGNVLGISVVHSMEVLRYSTVQFPAALFAELWAVGFLLELVLGRFRARPGSVQP